MKKTETKSIVLLAHHLKALRLPTMLAECEKVAARCATDNIDHLAFLLQLCELELINREQRAAGREFGHWKNTYRDGAGDRRVCSGKASSVREGDGIDHPIDGSPGRSRPAATSQTTVETRRAAS